MSNPQTYCLRTYGCQMNELDSEVMRGILHQRGLTCVDDEMHADIVIFNTCAVRDLAERKALGKLGQIIRRRSHKPIIGITGCMANAKKEHLFSKLPHVDFVLGTNNIHQLNTVLDLAIKGERPIKTDPKFSQELPYELARRNDPIKAFVSIIRGCNKHCTYCVVPYTRGPEVSRHPDSIVEECQRLIQQGYKEITLLGQNVNSYGKDCPEWKIFFPDLLYKLHSLAGEKWIRFMTSHPVDISQDLMEAIRDLSSVCEFVHFPLQAGADRILKKMNRGYTLQQYTEKVELLRSIVPNVALGTDIIVGFPTETHDEFLATCEAMKKLRFAVSFMFAYSPRKQAPSSKWADDVPKEIKEERLRTILKLQESICLEDMRSQLGTTVEVLAEDASSKRNDMLKGKTRRWQQVVFPGSSSQLGRLLTVRLTGLINHTFIGELVSGR